MHTFNSSLNFALLMSQDVSHSLTVHILSQSMDLNDIVRIAGELRSFMLPEVLMLREVLMLPEVKSTMKETVREETASPPDSD